MKLSETKSKICSELVAPLVGAWIEIAMVAPMLTTDAVAPLVGAWIEIVELFADQTEQSVAPLVGAWIEISIVLINSLAVSRSLLL